MKLVRTRNLRQPTKLNAEKRKNIEDILEKNENKLVKGTKNFYKAEIKRAKDRIAEIKRQKNEAIKELERQIEVLKNG